MLLPSANALYSKKKKASEKTFISRTDPQSESKEIEANDR